MGNDSSFPPQLSESSVQYPALLITCYLYFKHLKPFIMKLPRCTACRARHVTLGGFASGRNDRPFATRIPCSCGCVRTVQQTDISHTL